MAQASHPARKLLVPLVRIEECGPRVPLESLTRRVLAIPATSAAPERLFSSSGNTMTKKRTRLTCDNLEELVFLHETWPVVREWEANKRVRMDEKAEQAVDLTKE